MAESNHQNELEGKNIYYEFNSMQKKLLKFQDRLKMINFIGYGRKKKLLFKYGEYIEKAMEDIEKKQSLEKYLKDELGSYFYRIRGAWEQYKDGVIEKTGLIASCSLLLGKKFIDIFIHESREVLKLRKRNVYLTLNGIFGILFILCIFYFLLLIPINTALKPSGNFILPGNERFEWIFAMIMALIIIFLVGSIASFILSNLTLKIYLSFIGKNQKLGLVPTVNLFGSALYKKLISRAIIIGFLTFNLAYNLASISLFVSWMRGVDPEQISLLPDPELMIQIMWIVAIPCILVLVPIWLMMDIGLAKTKKISGFEFESVNLTGSKFYKFIKGYAGISFIYNLVLLIFAWANEDIPLIRIIMRIISPVIVISYMFILVVLIDYNNEKFKKKLWKQLEKYRINKKFNQIIEIQPIKSYTEILDY
ncbi:MAG: hypothetical protein ACFFAO_12405 [Candidatus Hermodarchaeota archaeon]